MTTSERAKAERRANRIETYAKRFAAKEACAKALGTGFRLGVFWRDLGVVNLPSGKPTMQLTGGALRRLQEMTPQGCGVRIDVSVFNSVHLAFTLDGVDQAQAEELISTFNLPAGQPPRRQPGPRPPAGPAPSRRGATSAVAR